MELKSSYRSFASNYFLIVMIILILYQLIANGIFFRIFELKEARDFIILGFVYALLFLAGALAEEPFIQRVLTKYLVTNKEVTEIKGIIRKRKKVIPFSSISDIKLEKGVIGRLLNFGTITIYSIRGEQIEIKGIVNPEKIFNFIKSNISQAMH